MLAVQALSSYPITSEPQDSIYEVGVMSTFVKQYSRNFHIHWNETGKTPCPEPENTPPRNNTKKPDGGASAYINENVRHPAFFPSETLAWSCDSPRKLSGAKMAVWRRAAILAAAKPRQCSGSCTGNFWQNGVSIFNKTPYLRGRSLWMFFVLFDGSSSSFTAKFTNMWEKVYFWDGSNHCFRIYLLLFVLVSLCLRCRVTDSWSSSMSSV